MQVEDRGHAIRVARGPGRASEVGVRAGAALLAFFVREPFPSVATGTEVDGAVVPAGEALQVVSEMDEGGVVFGDGIEEDRIDFAWGAALRVEAAAERLCLVRG